ncbi:hypothetical protein F01_430050 [Burkholderia cenocepacia]|nr:hypothetical protein F01_430050 [Burkholderia cenocepacia]
MESGCPVCSETNDTPRLYGRPSGGSGAVPSIRASPQIYEITYRFAPGPDAGEEAAGVWAMAFMHSVETKTLRKARACCRSEGDIAISRPESMTCIDSESNLPTFFLRHAIDTRWFLNQQPRVVGMGRG